MRRLASLVFLLVIMGTAAAGGQEVESVASLNPGDAVRITVWRKPDLSGEFFVGADSSIAHPFYSEVKVGGIPFAVATERVKQFVRRVEASPVLVEPLYQVMILGEVRNPKLYPVRPEVTIAQAIGLAGGTTERAHLQRVQLLRGGQSLLVDFTQPQGGRAQLTIRSGDQIVVPRRANVFREYVAPVASIMSALVAVANLVINNL